MEIERVGVIIARLQGKIGNTIYTRKHKQGYIARGTYKGELPTRKQLHWREQYTRVDTLYGQLAEEEKEKWASITHGKGKTRYSTFMHRNLLRASQGLPLIRIP